jgi:hypothetical protein
MVPEGYVADSPTSFSVRFRNAGTGAASFPPLDYGTYVLFDAGGLPMAFGALSEIPDEASTYEVAPGAHGTALNAASLAGCGVTVRPYIKFESLAAPHRP